MYYLHSARDAVLQYVAISKIIAEETQNSFPEAYFSHA